MVFHCLFEESGTFKNELRKMGFKAYDYDISNRFKETDYIFDLFEEINLAYEEKSSIFDCIRKNDVVFAFFPCIRFSVNAQLLFRCNTPQLNAWKLEDKLKYDLKLISELDTLYTLITKLVIIALHKGFKLIIENPYSQEHFLTKYWAVKPAIIDVDRRILGDKMKKPTQYYFINCEPKNNDIQIESFTGETVRENKVGTAYRSLIEKKYAEQFIKKYVI